MAYLERFSEQDRALIVSLPYRAGLWISHADGSGGSDAAEDEAAILSAIIERSGTGMFYSAFVHEVMAETYARKTEWAGWAGNLETVPEQGQAAVRLIEEKLTHRDAEAYYAMIMDIALEVAKAFREVDMTEPFWARCFSTLGLYREWLVNRLQGKDFDTALVRNISYAEDKALSELAGALKPVSDKA